MMERIAVQELEPGDVITFGGLDELPAFEDLVAAHLDPGMTKPRLRAWEDREGVHRLLRPPDHHGPITDVSLEVMGDSYQRLMTARKMGWTFGSDSRPGKASQDQEVIDSFWGFRLEATAHSTGRGAVGQIHAGLWYGLVPRRARTVRTLPGGEKKVYTAGERLVTNTGASVRRFVTKPRKDAELIEAMTNSRQIGTRVLSWNMTHPLTETMRE